MRMVIITAVGILLLASTSHAIDEKKFVDMTYSFSAETLHWPTAKPFNLETVNEGRTPQGFWYSSYN